jgi:DNA-binding beta-propeller fold protein YncE
MFVSARGPMVGTAVWLCALICVSIAGVGSAAATATPFGSEGEGAGQFISPRGVAVDQGSGDVYVVDRGNNRMDKFGPGGEFLLGWGWGVADRGTSALQACEAVCFRGTEGAGSGQFGGRTEGAAVDNSPGASRGDVYVQDVGNHRVEKFKPNGEFVLMFGGEVNATTHGNVCVAGETCQAGVEGAAAGEFEQMALDAIAVDSVGTVYVGGNGRVQEFSEGGVLTGQIVPAGAGSEILGLAVDASKELYVLSAEFGAPMGVRKYDGSGTELGVSRDPAAGYGNVIALGPSSELFVDDSEHGQLFEYDATGKEISSIATPAGVESMAFSDGLKGLYILAGGEVFVVSPPPPGPVVEADSESATEIEPTSATLAATLNSEGNEASYHFEYGLGDCASNACTSTPPTALPGGDGNFEDQLVSIGVSRLRPRTTYHYRVVVTNHCARSEPAHECTVDGPDQEFTSLPPVSIDNESVSRVSATSALLETELNTHGLSSEYRFEYGLSTAYEARVPVPDGNAGSGSSDVSMSILIEGLHAGAVYHYRVVAHNSLGTVEGPDRTFSTQTGGSSGLLDGRMWEMVSPPSKRGALFEPISNEGGLIQASEDGGALTYFARSPIDTTPAGDRSFGNQQLMSSRGDSGWSTQDIATPHELPAPLGRHVVEYTLFSPSLSVGLIEPEGSTPLAPQASERTPYLREPDGKYVPLIDPEDVPTGTKFGPVETNGILTYFGVESVGASSDLSHVVVTSSQPLTEGFETKGSEALYEWSGGALQPVSIFPESTPAEAVEGGALLGDKGKDVRNAVSTDGDRVFFSTQPAGSVGHLFVRDMAEGVTLQLDTPEVGANGGPGVATYQDASSDGKKVFFTDTEQLTANASSGESEPNLYMCEIGDSSGKLACKLKDLTVDRNPGEKADVLGDIVGSSEDGSYVYFTANGILNNDGVPVAGAIHGDCEVSFEELLSSRLCNLYVYDTVTGVTRLAAVLSNSDSPDWAGGEPGNLGSLTARVSANGRFLAFMSQRSLTGYDNRDVVSGAPDEEVYLYDSTSDHVVCASCDPTGARPTGLLGTFVAPPMVDQARLWKGRWLAGSVPGWTRINLGSARYQSRYLSDTGRLFFNSTVGLVPQDANGKEDVYEFEPDGIGGCASRTSSGSVVYVGEVDGSPVNGCVGLLSSGVASEESAFLDASGKGLGGEEGEDVFFLTAAKLSSADVDDQLDVYDAHTCSAESSCTVGPGAAPPACSTADSCRIAPSPQPSIFGAPASATFSGAGNVVPPTVKPAVRGKSLTRAQKLAKALSTCQRKPKKQRAGCKRRARRAYGSAHKAKKSLKGGK